MRLAQEFDAVHHAIPYSSTHRRRLIAPDLRSRVVGYLGTAPVAAPGHRTDGVWVWPERLAEQARAGVGPQEQLYEHLRHSSFLLPEHVPAALLATAAEAVHGPPTADPDPTFDWMHLTEHSGESSTLLRIRLREDGSVAESSFGPVGWDPGHAQAVPAHGRRVDRRQFVEISGPEAATLNTRLAGETHDARVARDRESEPVPGALRLARVYDGEGPSGTPWFSPNRLRLPEPVRRERIAGYLDGGRMVVRATGRMADPMDPGHGGPVPLSYRTDGVWVWQESLAHYVRTRGVAPEMEFLGHIEARGYRLPAEVPADLVPIAGAVVKAGPPPRLFRPTLTYYWEPSGGIARSRGREPGRTESLRDDLRWASSGPDLPAPAYREITEADAVSYVDARWSGGAALPPLD